MRGHIATFVLALSTATFAPAQSGPALPPGLMPLFSIGGDSGEAKPLPPIADEIPTREAEPSPAAGDAKGASDPQLLSLLHEEARLLENFGPDHPQVQSVRERIRLARASLAGQPAPPRQDDPPAVRLLPEVITLTGATVREPRPPTSTVAPATADADAPRPPPARVPEEPAPKNRSDPEPPGPLGLVLQWIGLGAVCSFGLAALSLLAYLSYRRAGGGSPLIQVHLVNTQTRASEPPAGYPPPLPVERSHREAPPAQAKPAVETWTEWTAGDTLEGRDAAIAEQVLAMNLQLKAEMMKAEGAGGEPAPFGPARAESENR
jgi:hypothetical protein